MNRIRVAAAVILCSVLATSAAPAYPEDKPNAVERTASKVAKGTEKTAKRAGKFVEKTATRSGKFVERTAAKAEKAVRRLVE